MNALVKPLWKDMRERRVKPLELLTELGLSEPPVDPFFIARALGVTVECDDFPYEGALDSTGASPVIHVRASDITPRQRFTAAHELGHLILHPLGEFFRDEKLGGRRGLREVQANRYAAELLMPALWVRERLWRGEKFDDLMATFGVSRSALMARLEALAAF
jgi:hypothetical protein